MFFPLSLPSIPYHFPPASLPDTLTPILTAVGIVLQTKKTAAYFHCNHPAGSLVSSAASGDTLEVTETPAVPSLTGGSWYRQEKLQVSLPNEVWRLGQGYVVVLVIIIMWVWLWV